MDRAAYEDYLRRFNAKDYDGVLEHFTDDLEVVFAGYAFRSKPEVKAFYAFLHEHVREEIEVGRYLTDGSTIALEAQVRITGLKPADPAELEARGLQRLVFPPPGVTVTIPQFIHYHLRDGRFARALCAIFEPGPPAA